MKKLILIIALLFFSFSFSQDYKIVYNKVFYKEWKEQKTLFEFKNNLEILEITNLDSGIKRELIKLTDFNEFKTDGGYTLMQAIYYDQITKTKIGIQMFEEKEYGIRVIYNEENSFQYAGILSKE
jgi:hypothetical protein